MATFSQLIAFLAQGSSKDVPTDLKMTFVQCY